MKRIAVVEDNADNRQLIHALLEDLYEVVAYESGAEALAGMAKIGRASCRERV